MHALLIVAALAAATADKPSLEGQATLQGFLSAKPPRHPRSLVAFDASAAPRLRVPGRALIKVKGVDDARELLIGKPNDAAVHALSEIGARHGVQLAFVKASLFGW